MGRYLDALRNFRTPHHANQKNLINPAQEGYLGLLGSPPPPIENSIGIKSRWWLVHFRDRAPVEICCNPIAAADTVLRDIAGAVSAEAIADGSSELIHQISTAIGQTLRFVWPSNAHTCLLCVA
jgi:hypothetical protein